MNPILGAGIVLSVVGVAAYVYGGESVTEYDDLAAARGADGTT